MDEMKSSKDGTREKKTTIFSINPETGYPYMTLSYAVSLARSHIYKTSKNLLQLPHLTIDDLVQEVMVKMLSAPYDPKKSGARTFFIICASSHLGHVFKRNVSAGERYRCRSDFTLCNNDDEVVFATDVLGVENITPFDTLQAQETVREHYKTHKAESVPVGFRGFRNKTKETKKRKKKCK